MAVTVSITDKGQSAPLSTAKSTLAWLGVSSAGNTPGTVAAVYQFSAPANVAPNVGYGPGPEGVAAGVRVSQLTQVFCRVNASIAGVTGSVSQTGTSPLITLSGAPYDSYPLAKLKITKSGVLGTAQGQVALDGGTWSPVFDLPLQVAASVVSTVDESGWNAGNYTALNGQTLIVTPSNGVMETVAFSATTSANFLAQINAVIGPANALGSADLTAFTWTSLGTETLNFTMGDGTVVPVTFATPANQTAALATINTALGSHGVASVVTQGGKNYLRIQDTLTGTASLVTVNAGTANAALGLPASTTTFYGAQASIVAGKYLRIMDGATGSTSTLAIGAGTGNLLLGVTIGSTTGANATYIIANSGITVTFPAGTYNSGEVYSWSSMEPRFTTADLVTAMAALQQAQVPFTDIVLLCNPIDGTDTRAFVNQLATSLSTWRGASPRIYALGIMNSSIAMPSMIAANDLDVKAAMQGQNDDYVAVCHGDVFMTGTAISGSFRRPAAFAIGIRAAAYPISSDPGNREQPALEEANMVGPDLMTLARDEQTATTKMQSQGFTALKSVLGAAYAVQGLTRSASATFRYMAVMRTAIAAARLIYGAAQRYENASRFAAPNGTLRPSDAAAIKKYVETLIDNNLSNDISGRAVSVDTTSIITQTNQLNFSADIQQKADFFNVNAALGVVQILESASGAAAPTQ